ncbi:MAG: glycosyltransferase [Cytophagaceae bacterium]
MDLIFLLYATAFCIQVIYLTYLFIHFISHREEFVSGLPLPAISIIICAHNEYDNLESLILQLDQQEYPQYEVILVDDRSTDRTFQFYEKQFQTNNKFRIIRIENEVLNYNSKKYALNEGIKQAQFENILVTDADCVPKSNQWLRNMGNGFLINDLVLGYSPYKKASGWLNKLIRFETLYTGFQYLSFAIGGHAYMGVGRNLGYKKKLFDRLNGFQGIENHTGGDDDLLIQKMKGRVQATVLLNNDSQVVSIPKKEYKSWFNQKLRHIAAGKQYNLTDKLILGGFSAANLIFYFSFMLLLFLRNFEEITIILFILRTLLIIVIFVKVSRKLNDSISWFWIPVLDLIYYLNYFLVGLTALFSKRIKWI